MGTRRACKRSLTAPLALALAAFGAQGCAGFFLETGAGYGVASSPGTGLVHGITAAASLGVALEFSGTTNPIVGGSIGLGADGVIALERERSLAAGGFTGRLDLRGQDLGLGALRWSLGGALGGGLARFDGQSSEAAGLSLWGGPTWALLTRTGTGIQLTAAPVAGVTTHAGFFAGGQLRLRFQLCF